MGNTWDGGDLAFRPETWQAFGNVLHDGAFGMAFSASRNWHRMAVAIEDAGFILHPTIFLWAYGQGFPKATRVKGHEEFNGHRYGLQALKPAVEPIIVFQKPYSGKPVENIVQTGAGALNIEDSRIGTSKNIPASPRRAPQNQTYGDYSNDPGTGGSGWDANVGRWPSNLLLTEDSAERLDIQTGNLKSGKMFPTSKRSTDGSPNGIYGKFDIDAPLQETIGDSGGASRFFYQVSTQIDEADPAYYCAKVSPKERNAGLDDMPDVMSGMSGGAQSQGEGYDKGQDIGLNRVTAKKNTHPTLKPINLCKYLATLLLPPIEYAPRRIFIPFSGVASEMCGAGLAGWEHVVGVEFDKDNGYVDIAEKRMQYWMNK